MASVTKNLKMILARMEYLEDKIASRIASGVTADFLQSELRAQRWLMREVVKHNDVAKAAMEKLEC